MQAKHTPGVQTGVYKHFEYLKNTPVDYNRKPKIWLFGETQISPLLQVKGAIIVLVWLTDQESLFKGYKYAALITT